MDLCHQANEEEDEEEEDDDENCINQALLEVLKTEPGSPHVKDHRRCCFQGIHVGSRQKYVIMVMKKIPTSGRCLNISVFNRLQIHF